MQLAGTDIENQVSRLLVNHLNSNRAFAGWFWERVSRGRRKLPPFKKARAVVSYPRQITAGQTDFGFASEGDRAVILGENKISHALSRDQRERYKEERDGLIRAGWAATIVLVAPKCKIDSIGCDADDFDACVSYEEMNEQLGGDPFILKAIKRCEQGCLARGIPAVTSNFDGYAKLAHAVFPRLRLLTKVGNNPTQSRTATFDSSFAEGEPRGAPDVYLLHQWQQGTAKLLFRDWAQHRAQLSPIMKADLAGSGFVVDPGTPKVKSLGFMKETPLVDNHASFKVNEAAFIDGLQVVEELHDWYLANLPTVSMWIAAVSKLR